LAVNILHPHKSSRQQQHYAAAAAAAAAHASAESELKNVNCIDLAFPCFSLGDMFILKGASFLCLSFAPGLKAISFFRSIRLIHRQVRLLSSHHCHCSSYDDQNYSLLEVS
jgi:hypothetical protein